MMSNGLTVVLLSAVVVLASRRMRSLTAVALASIFYAIGFGSYRFAGTMPLVIASTVVWTIGEILGATNGNAFIAERAPETHRSRVNSVVSFGHLLGSAMAPLIAGPLAARIGSARLWTVVGAAALVAATYQFVIDRIDCKSRPRGCGARAA